MSLGKEEALGNPIDLSQVDARWAFPNQHTGELPLLEPGLAIITAPDGQEQLVSRRHNDYRPAHHGSPGTYETDVNPVSGAALPTNQEEPHVFGHGRQQGTEAEFSIVDEAGRPVRLAEAGVEPETPELWDNTWEVSGNPEVDSATAYRSLFSAIRSVQNAVGQEGLAIDPASARMQDTPGRTETNPHAYVQAMIDALGDEILSFTGVGIHEHYDFDMVHAPEVIQYVRELAPFMNLGLLAAPFMHSSIKPDMFEILGADELQNYRDQTPLSTRYLTRSTASKYGGAGMRVGHGDLTSYLEHADRLVSGGKAKSPERGYGQHADVRLRVDPPSPHLPDHRGRIELCVKDTAGLHYEALVAYSELTRAILAKLEAAAAEGEQGLQKLHQQYPQIFGETRKSDSQKAQALDRVHLNSIAIAYEGADAKIQTENGESITAREQLHRLLEFANLSSRYQPTIFASVADPKQVTKLMQKHKDEQGLPTMEGYYRTGAGTPAQWMIERANALSDRGAFTRSEESILLDGTRDRQTAFGKYLLAL